MSGVTPEVRVFRLPAMTWVPVLFLWVGCIPVAFASGGGDNSAAHLGLSLLVFLVPAVVSLFVVRTATVVNAAGLAVRAPFGQRVMSWNDVRGLSVTGRAVYAVLRGGGAVRLPCVRVSMLSELSRAAGGRLPEMSDPVVKAPPVRQRRR